MGERLTTGASMSEYVTQSDHPVFPWQHEKSTYAYTENEILELAYMVFMDKGPKGLLSLCFHDDALGIPVADALCERGWLKLIRIQHVKHNKSWYQYARLCRSTRLGRELLGAGNN